MEQRSVERRLALLDDVLVQAANLARDDANATLPLRLCVDRLLVESEIARLTLMLDPRREELQKWVNEIDATEVLAEEICRRDVPSNPGMASTLRIAKQAIGALAQALGEARGVPSAATSRARRWHGSTETRSGAGGHLDLRP